MKNSRNTYLYKIIDRATSNNLFENNKIGNYTITPQHGINCFVYNIYKNGLHFISVTITEGIFVEQFQKLTKKESKSFVSFFLNEYKEKSLIVKEL